MRTLVHLSDLHFGMIDAPVADALVPYLKSLPYDILVVSGDFTQCATATQYQEAIAWVEQFPGPRLYVPGNHDVPLFAVWERFFSTLGRYRKWVTRDLQPLWEDDEMIVVGVTTPRAFVPVFNGFWKDGRITEKQLRHVVARAEQKKFSVVVTHHPFVPPPGHRADGVVLGGGKVLPLLARAGVDVLLAGHLHASYHARLEIGSGRAGDRGGESAKRSIFSVQASTATSTRRRHDPQGREYANAFNVLRCSQQRLEIEVHSFAEGRWGLTSRTAYTRDGLAWREAE